jgi:hypothetical protein
VSLTACLLGAGIGLALGAWLAVARFPGPWRGGVGDEHPAGAAVGGGGPDRLPAAVALRAAGLLGLLFTPTAMVVAQSMLVVPLIAALTRRLVLDGLAEGGDQLRSMGAGPFLTRPC